FDLVVTKAGPGAIAEALATGVPLVITGFLPGQESPNVDFVVESRIGAFAPKESDLVDEVRVLAEGGPTWREMSRKAEELAHPYASSDTPPECHLQVAAPPRDGSAALVIDDPPTAVSAVDAVDHAAKLPAIHRDVELLLEVRRDRIQSAASAIGLEIRGTIAHERGNAARVRKRGLLPDVVVDRAQSRAADRPAFLAQLACP